MNKTNNENLVLRNSTNYDFELSFEVKSASGLEKTNEHNYFLFAKSHRIFEKKRGKHFIRFFHQTNLGQFLCEFCSPGFFEIKMKKDGNGVLIKEEKIVWETLNEKINTFFGESEDFIYDIRESSRFKDLLQLKEKNSFMFPTKEQTGNLNIFSTLMNSNSTSNTDNFYTVMTEENIENQKNVNKAVAIETYDPKYISKQIIPNLKNHIDFTNNSKKKIFVRLNSDDQTDNYLKEVEKASSIRWLRNSGKRFLIQLERTKNLKKGPVYEVSVGEAYVLDNTNQLRLKNGEEIKLSAYKFSENLNSAKFASEELPRNYKTKASQPFGWLKNIKNSKQGFLQFLTAKKHKIVLNNLSNQVIKVSVSLNNLENKSIIPNSTFDSSNNNYEIINSNSSFALKKNEKGKYILEILRESSKGKPEIKHKFKVYTGNSYTFNSFHLLIQDNNGKNVNELNEKESSLGEALNQDVLVSASRRSTKENISTKEINKLSKNFDYYKGLIPNYTPGTEFKDSYFPPNYKSIAALDSTGSKHILPHFPHLPPQNIEEEVLFVNPDKIFKQNPYHLFKDKIESNDVLQGELGNCYLMSVISAMGQRSDLIQEAFCSKKTNSDGFYQIYFYDTDGSRKIMFVDHFFPFIKKAGKKIPLGARPNGEEIWVMILEKAYAKYEGGYVNINGGTILDELFWLTGCFCQEFNLNKSKYAWENLMVVCSSKNIVCSKSNKGTGSHSDTSSGNIANSHAYSILGADEYKGIRLLTLRNPWGDTEWKGEFSDESDSWTPELKAHFGYEIAKGENGIFFMKFEDFKKEFNNVIICFC